MIPKFIQLADNSNANVREYALECLNCFIGVHADVMFAHLDPFVQVLSRRASDPEGKVRKLVCSAFVMLLETRPDFLLPQLQGIANFMFHAMQDSDDQVALEAGEFWLAFAENDELREYLRPLMPQLIPLLIKCMIYTDSDLVMLDDEDEDDGDTPDSAQDLKPRHHKAKTHELGPQDKSAPDAPAHTDSDSEFGDSDDDDEVYSEWTVRKCAASTLDVMAGVYGTEILPPLLPLLNEQLFSKEWKQRELGVLALGAIAEGCMSGIEPHLPQLYPFLIQCMSDAKPLVRSIACWTMSRYARWCLYPTDGSDKRKYSEPMLATTLQAMMDKNKRVQEAAVSALATIEEEAGEDLAPYLPQILQAMVGAFGKYHSKNLLILFDAVGTLAECVGAHLARKEYVETIMPPLIQRWNKLTDDDTGLFPLLECLSAVAVALAETFEPYAKPVYERCLRLIQKTVTEDALFNQNPAGHEPPEKDFMIVALDLISGLVQALGQKMIPIIKSVTPNLLEVLAHAVKDQSPDVRQSAFALLGDMSIHLFDLVKPHVNVFLPIIVEQCGMSPTGHDISAINNACWACGEVAIRYGKEIQPVVGLMMDRLVPILSNSEIPRTLHENAAITLGRFGLVLPQIVAPHLESFAEHWCKALRHTRENDEKESAFRGFCQLIQTNPGGVVKAFPLFCEAVSLWRQPTGDLHQMFAGVLGGIKGMMGEQQWQAYFQTFPVHLRERLQQKYGIA